MSDEQASNYSIQPRYPYPRDPPMGALAAADSYSPSDWPAPPGAGLPDVGAPLIPSGPQISAGQPWANAIAANAPAAVAAGIKQSVMTPGAIAKPNPYPSGSEEADWYDRQRLEIGDKWARDQALSTIGSGLVGGAPGPGVTLGAGAVRKGVKSPTGFAPGEMFDYSNLGDVPNVPQFDLARNIPPRGVPQRTLDITNDPGVRDKMMEVIAQGQKMGGANWYNAEPLRQAFNAELGKGGDAAFRKYMDFVAATSPRSDVGTNVRNASYYYGRAMRGEPMPAVGDVNPQPYGHMAQRLHQMNAERVAGAGWDPLNNPKPASFVENLVGNQQPATIDTHAFRLPAILAQDPRFLETAFQVSKDAPKQNIAAMVGSGEIPMSDAAGRAAWWQAQPKPNEYAAMENYYKSLGKDLGLTPAQTQASAWVGGGKTTGLASDESKPFLRFFEDRLNLTAEKRGETPKQTLKAFIRGKAPLLTAPPAAIGALAAQNNYQPQE